MNKGKSLVINYHKVIPTYEQNQILLGSLLGDGNLDIPPRCRNAHFRVHHKEGDKDYLFWKYNELESLGLFRKPYLGKSSGFGKVRYRWCLASRCHPVFTELYFRYYPHGVKIVNLELIKDIGLLGLAVFYMDDGTAYYRTRGNRPRIRLSTHGYIKEENEVIRDWIFSLCGLRFRVARHRNKYYILSLDSWRDCVKFMNVLSPYVAASMSRKIKEAIRPKEALRA